MRKFYLVVVLCSLLLNFGVSAQNDIEFEFEMNVELDPPEENDNNLVEVFHINIDITNNGSHPIHCSTVTFRAHIGTSIPLGIPSAHHGEMELTLDNPIDVEGSYAFTIELPYSILQSNIDNVVTVWPVVAEENNLNRTPDYFEYQIVRLATGTIRGGEVRPFNTFGDFGFIGTISIRPNPPRGRTVNIEVPGDVDINEINVYNSLGMLVKTLPMPTQTSFPLDLTGLESGMYYITANDRTGKPIMNQKMLLPEAK